MSTHPEEFRFVRARTLAELLCVHRGTLYRWVREGLIPKPIKLTPGTSVWRMADVEAVLRDRERAPS